MPTASSAAISASDTPRRSPETRALIKMMVLVGGGSSMSDNKSGEGSTTSAQSLDQQVRVEAFRAIYRGKTPSVTELANQLAEPANQVRMAVERLVGRGLMTLDDDERVNGSHGLSLVPGDHSLRFNVGERYVWCAMDAVGIPAALRVDAQIASRCFYCRAPVALTIKEGEPVGLTADSLRIGIGAAGSRGKVIEDVCPMINFFCSRDHAEAWAATTGRANIIEMRHAAEIGRREWADVA